MNLDLDQRIVLPELLDDLAPSDAGAVASRRDLQRLNFLMGHASVIGGVLLDRFARRPPARLVELGAGDGTGMLRVARALSPRWPAVRVTLVDRRPCVSAETHSGMENLGWKIEVVTADVFDWLPRSGMADAIIANLFLHHFEPGKLTQLLALMATRCRVMVACEPRRAARGLFMTRLFWMMGCHPVTRHDAAISVRAGFKSQELSDCWPGGGWQREERRAGIFSHLFAATKHEPRK